jgi:hypothetical protein
MKSLLALGFSFVFLASAQQYRAPGGVVYTSPNGTGNAVFPGTGRPPTPGPVYNSFATRLGATVAGHPIGNGGRRSSSVVGYPVYVGGYSGYYGDQQAPQQPNVVIVNQPPPPQQAPTVIINQNFGPLPPQTDAAQSDDPTSHVFQPQSQQQPVDASSSQRYYLLAFKDASVYSALAYWIEDKTLHYVTPGNTHNQASLDLVDVEFTKKLNQDRNVPFTLAPSPAR